MRGGERSGEQKELLCRMLMTDEEKNAGGENFKSPGSRAGSG